MRWMSLAGTSVFMEFNSWAERKVLCSEVNTGKPVKKAEWHRSITWGMGCRPPVRMTPASGTPLSAAMQAASKMSSRSPGVTTRVPALSVCSILGMVRAQTVMDCTRRSLIWPSLIMRAPKCSATSAVRGATSKGFHCTAPMHLKSSFWNIGKMAANSSALWCLAVPSSSGSSSAITC